MKFTLAVSSSALVLFLCGSLFGCAHSPKYDPEMNLDYKGKPQGPIFYHDGRLAFYGDAAQAMFNDIQSNPIQLDNGNVLKPAYPQTASIQCTKVKDHRKENAWFYACGIGIQELTKEKK